jgi:hypothetical protein
MCACVCASLPCGHDGLCTAVPFDEAVAEDFEESLDSERRHEDKRALPVPKIDPRADGDNGNISNSNSIIADDEIEQAVETSGFVHRLRRFLVVTSLGRFIDACNIGLSAAYCAGYVIQASSAAYVDQRMLTTLMSVCAVYFTGYFLLTVLLAQSTRRQLMSVNTLLDVASVAPYTFAAMFSTELAAVGSVAFGDFLVKALKAFALLRCFQLELAVKFVSDQEKKQQLAYVAQASRPSGKRSTRELVACLKYSYAHDCVCVCVCTCVCTCVANPAAACVRDDTLPPYPLQHRHHGVSDRVHCCRRAPRRGELSAAYSTEGS